MDGIVVELRSKKILQQVVTAWAKIDLSQYDNSAITTLEEHIKRKWADISASTAGEQYTPDDIISLIAEIVASKVSKDKNEYIHIYDPTCGGANLLFGVADRLKNQSGYNYVATYGSEYNDALYALAAIESRFRDQSDIRYGNTLTTVPFEDKEFDVIVANPPYGTKWSGYEKEIKADQKGQFEGGLPSVSDGQLLFMQHILWQLARTGIAVEVHNGSTLFSGDAGSGESNIRKFIFDHDWVEAIIQMPQQEFFNTGIYTYLWIMNKNKPENCKDKIALIDASNSWKPLRKSKGDKRRKMLPEHRKVIVETLNRFENSEICKVYDREHFYYNKQFIKLYETNDANISIKQTLCPDGGSVEIKPQSLRIGDELFNKFKGLTTEERRVLQEAWVSKTNNWELVDKEGNSYTIDTEDNSVLRKKGTGEQENLGCGTINLKIGALSKKTLTASAKVTIAPITYNDYEIIAHHFDTKANQSEIEAFMGKYVFKPFEYKKNVVGVELNFNKEFYVPEVLDKTDDILSEIAKLEKRILDKLKKSEIFTIITRGLNPKISLKDSGINYIGAIPAHWSVKRFKELYPKYTTGFTPDSKDDRYFSNGDGKIWVTIADLNSKYISDSIIRLSDYAIKKFEATPTISGSLLFSFKLSIGKMSFAEKELYTNEAIVSIPPSKKYCLNYYYYLLPSVLLNNATENIYGAQMLNQAIIANMLIPVPPLSEQMEIAEYLDARVAKIDAKIATINEQVKMYEHLKRSLIYEVVTGKKEIL